MRPWCGALLLCSLLPPGAASGSQDLNPVQRGREDGEALKRAAAGFSGEAGVVLHVGDSLTIASPYAEWARRGKGKTPRDEAVLRWMHVGAKDDSDGWYLCTAARGEHLSATAAGGLRADECLSGKGKRGLPPLSKLLKKYNPQIVVVLLGTYDLVAGRAPGDYGTDMAKIADTILSEGSIPILTTLPPYPGREELTRAYNDALAEVARNRTLPVIDLWGEMLKRRPEDWKGKLTDPKGCHLNAAGEGGATSGSEPTEENLRNSGYLLRGWLTVRKMRRSRKGS